MYFFIIICSETATSEMYFVTPLVCSNAKKQPCLTLSQFAANASDYPNSNITLNILPGNHNLHSRLHLTNLDIFSMVSESSTATIVCQEPANIFLQSISQVSIEKMEFIGCGGNVIHSSTSNELHFLYTDLAYRLEKYICRFLAYNCCC